MHNHDDKPRYSTRDLINPYPQRIRSIGPRIGPSIQHSTFGPCESALSTPIGLIKPNSNATTIKADVVHDYTVRSKIRSVNTQPTSRRTPKDSTALLEQPHWPRTTISHYQPRLNHCASIDAHSGRFLDWATSWLSDLIEHPQILLKNRTHSRSTAIRKKMS
jgi:hypothetical protein